MTHRLITIAEVMLTPVGTVRAAMLLSDALLMMRCLNTQNLVVEPIRPGDGFAILTTRDVFNRALASHQKLETATVSDLMSPAPLLVAPEMRVEDCASLMLTLNLHIAVVVRGGRAIGLIRDSDLFQAIEGCEEPV